MSASGKMLLRHDNAVSLSCSPPSQLRLKRKMKLSESDMMILTVVRRPFVVGVEFSTERVKTKFLQFHNNK